MPVEETAGHNNKVLGMLLKVSLGDIPGQTPPSLPATLGTRGDAQKGHCPEDTWGLSGIRGGTEGTGRLAH